MEHQMEHQMNAKCACLNIVYKVTKNKDGTFTSMWECVSCGAKFIPARYLSEAEKECDICFFKKHADEYYAVMKNEK